MSVTIAHRRVTVADPRTGNPIRLFYREAGPADAPVLLLIHGFPTSSHMFRGLIPALADKYRVIAPDLPGFGFSDAPAAAEFGYGFAHLTEVVEGFVTALGLERYALYVFDYGAPIGLRLALSRPERVTALISQNGNAYEEGLSPGFAPMRAYWADPSASNREALRAMLQAGTTQFQYTHGVEDAETRVAPEAYTLDQHFLDRVGSDEAQLDLFRDYQSNLALYPAFQAWFRDRRPPTLAVWGRNDPFFLPAGAEAFRRDNPEAEVRFVDGGHFALETHLDEIVGHIRRFLARVLDAKQGSALFGPLAESALAPSAGPAVAAAKDLFGFLPNLALAFAAAPAALAGYVDMLKAFGGTALSGVEQQVVLAAASHANGADYGVAVHATLAAKLGAAEDVAAALRAGGVLPDAKLEALAAFARAIATGRTQVSDAYVAGLTAAGYDAGTAVAVAFGVASKTFANAVAHLARPEIDAVFRPAESV